MGCGNLLHFHNMNVPLFIHHIDSDVGHQCMQHGYKVVGGSRIGEPGDDVGRVAAADMGCGYSGGKIIVVYRQLRSFFPGDFIQAVEVLNPL